MKQGNDKYLKIIDLLRRSKPVLDSTGDIEREVIREISRIKEPIFNLAGLIDFLFGWVYIGWVRRSFVTVSLLLVLVFVYQQGVIMKQINILNRQLIITGGEPSASGFQHFEKLLMMYKRSDRGFTSSDITISEQQLKELIETINELQIKYQYIEKLVEEDPKLKQFIEQKLIENNQTKVNL